MGMFDTIIIECPECGNEIECQSKSGDCTLKRLSLRRACAKGDEALFDINRHAPHVCNKCGKAWEVQVKMMAVAEVVRASEYIEPEMEDDDYPYMEH